VNPTVDREYQPGSSVEADEHPDDHPADAENCLDDGRDDDHDRSVPVHPNGVEKAVTGQQCDDDADDGQDDTHDPLESSPGAGIPARADTRGDLLVLLGLLVLGLRLLIVGLGLGSLVLLLGVVVLGLGLLVLVLGLRLLIVGLGLGSLVLLLGVVVFGLVLVLLGRLGDSENRQDLGLLFTEGREVVVDGLNLRRVSDVGVLLGGLELLLLGSNCLGTRTDLSGDCRRAIATCHSLN